MNVRWQQQDRSLWPVPETCAYCSVVAVDCDDEHWIFVRRGKPFVDSPESRRAAELLGLPSGAPGWFDSAGPMAGECEMIDELRGLLEILHTWTRGRWWLCDLYETMRPDSPLPTGGRWQEKHGTRRAG